MDVKNGQIALDLDDFAVQVRKGEQAELLSRLHNTA
jgi:hypothetical protein